jgi:ClpA/ClpB-like protein
MAKATTVRFADEIYARLDQASARTGMPVNSIVVAACLEWMERHTPSAAANLPIPMPGPPRWSTLRRAMVEATAGRPSATVYPFERFTAAAKKFLTAAQSEAMQSGDSYIGTEHLMLAAFADPASDAARILASFGATEKTVRAELTKMLVEEKAERKRSGEGIVPTSRVKKVIELAFALSGGAGQARVSTAHILLALVSEGEGVAAHVLKNAHVTAERVSVAMDVLTEPEG